MTTPALREALALLDAPMDWDRDSPEERIERFIVDCRRLAALAPSTPEPLDVEWFVTEVVAYFRLFDHEDIWREPRARALGEWLKTRKALQLGAVEAGEVAS